MGDDSGDTGATDTGGLSRRDFVALSVAAGIAGIAPGVAADGLLETEVTITTPDGSANAVFVRGAGVRAAGVLLWTDAFGLRPTMREFARRLAGAGYAVLLPNPYYRTPDAGTLDAASFDFGNPADRTRLQGFMEPLAASGAAERDTLAYAAFLDAQPEVDTARKLGAFGYCMGGRLTFRTLAALPARFGAGASFHGGGLVTDKPDSPHRLIPKMNARLYVGIAENDDSAEPAVKQTLREAFDAAGMEATIEVWPGTLHGWCVPDMPARNGQPIYNHADAERAWQKLLELFGTSLG